MVRIVPTEFITTDLALIELAQRDAEWSRLDAAFRAASGRPHVAAWTARGNRLTELENVLLRAVACRDIVAVVVECATDGKWSELELPPSHWNELAGSVSLHRGAVAGTDSRHDGSPLCFRRHDWQAWLKRRANDIRPSASVPVLVVKPTLDDVLAWYQRRVIDHDPRQPPPSRPDDEKAAKDHFKIGGLKELVREARRQAAPKAWQEAGPKGRKLAARQQAAK